MRVFVDTGGWYSVINAADQMHEVGSRYYLALRSFRARVITSDYVLDEVITRLRYDVGHAPAKQFLDLVDRSRETAALTIVTVTSEIWSRAEDIFIRYSDAKLSFTDCTSFALLEENPVDEVFGYDSHFAMMGHVLRPK